MTVRLKALQRRMPLALTTLRAALAPVVVCLAIYAPSRVGFGLCLAVAFLSDVFDGIIARHLGVATAALRRLDSITDTIFYLAAIYAAWHLYPLAIVSRIKPIIALAGLEVVRYGFDWIKFRREASYHMWSSKAWGVALFVGFFWLLALGSNNVMLTVAIYVGILADIEGLVISMIMRTWKADVPTVIHALRAP